VRRRTVWPAIAFVALALATGEPYTHAQTVVPQPRVTIDADAGWRFSRGDFASASRAAFDDSAWARVDLPHDWSANGPCTNEFGSGNGFAPVGIGWYRKHFTVPADTEAKVGVVEFDGIYDNSEVWVNGHLACGRPYGFSSFECPLTPFVRFGGVDNVIAVRVDHSRFADSRWYTGSGIYRHVRFRFSEPVHIGHWGTSITTPAVTATSATVNIETVVENTSTTGRSFQLLSEVLMNGAVVLSVADDTDHSIPASGRVTLTQTVTLPQPHRWSPDSPSLYTLRQRVRVFNSTSTDPNELTRAGLTTTDVVETMFGVRSIRFDANAGLVLNGTSLKLKGVCLHEDGGSVGVAVPPAVWERRLRALKAVGVNAIRTSHNPPAPEFLDLVDRLGFVVMDEAFDEFTPAKNKWVAGWNQGVPSRFGYAEQFAEWSVRDASDMVRRDRNHPSIVMWSIGNEIDYPNDPFSHPALGRSYRPANPPAENLVTLAKPLVAAVKSIDPTRPVTMALASVEMSNAVDLPALLDVVGYNYQESRYTGDHAAYPNRVIYGSENNHAFDNWTIVRDNPWIAGQFLWTGVDYLGEARAFPNRANGAGLFDLAGFKKPLAWFRQSLWSNEPMVYVATAPAAAPGRNGGPPRVSPPEERWNWAAGQSMTASVYTNADTVTLSINGRPLGAKPRTSATAGVLTWDLPFEPGELKAVATTAGRAVASFSLRTAATAKRIELIEDRSATVSADDGTRQLEVIVVDANGLRVPDAAVDVTLAISGPATILGIGNGDLSDLDPPLGTTHKTFQGRGLAVLRITDGGAVTIAASAPGLEGAALTLTARRR
jgi:beta-galactosidase